MDLDTTHLIATGRARSAGRAGCACMRWCSSPAWPGWLGWVTLPSGLQVLQHPLVLGASGLMLAVEFFADKIPGARHGVGCGAHASSASRAGMALAAGCVRWRLGGVDRRSRRCSAARWPPPRHVAKATTRGGGQHVARAVLQHRPVAARRRCACRRCCGWRSAHPVWFFVALARRAGADGQRDRAVVQSSCARCCARCVRVRVRQRARQRPEATNAQSMFHACAAVRAG